MSAMEYAGIRVYQQEDGRYKAVGTVERKDADGNLQRKQRTSSEQTTPGQALAEVLQLTGFLDP